MRNVFVKVLFFTLLTCVNEKQSLNAQTILNTAALMNCVDSAFVFNAEIGGDISTGNAEVVDISGGIFAGWGNEHMMLRVIGGGNLLQEETNVIQQGVYSQIRFNYFLNAEKNVDVFLFTQWQGNRVLLLNARFLAGGGFRCTLLERGITIHSSLGSFFEQEDYVPETTEPKQRHARSSITVVVQRESEDFTLQYSSYIQHAIGDFGDYRFFNELTANFRLSRRLYFSIDLITRYDSQPHGGLKSFDAGFVCGLGIEWQKKRTSRID